MHLMLVAVSQSPEGMPESSPARNEVECRVCSKKQLESSFSRTTECFGAEFNPCCWLSLDAARNCFLPVGPPIVKACAWFLRTSQESDPSLFRARRAGLKA